MLIIQTFFSNIYPVLYSLSLSRVLFLWCVRRYGGRDSSSMIADSGLTGWGASDLDEEVNSLLEEVGGGRPRRKLGLKTLEMKKIKKGTGIGLI